MNIFLDSTVFQNGKDVYFNNEYNKTFLRICKQQNINIYLSTVVIQEVRRQYEIFMNGRLKDIAAGLGALSTIPMQGRFSKSLPTLPDILKEYDKYFHPENSEYFKIINYTNDILPELVHRSINRIKPFTESKQEFRDAIIWFSYADYAENNSLENCYFVSGNTNDYVDRNGDILPELKERSNRFNFIKSIYDLLQLPEFDPYKETLSSLDDLRGMIKEWDYLTLMSFLTLHSSLDYIHRFFIEGTLLKEFLVEMNHKYVERSIEKIHIRVIEKVKLYSIDVIENKLIVGGKFILDLDIESSQMYGILEDLEYWDESFGLIVDFNAEYDSELNQYNNLEIRGFMDANVSLEQTHRLGGESF